MTKFEEEVKRPDNTGIDPFSKRDVDFSKLAAKFTRAAQTLKNWRNYTDYLENKIDRINDNLLLETQQSAIYHAEIVEQKRENQRLNAENLDIKTLMDDARPQQALPVVKDFVAEWYEEHKADLDFSIFEACVSLYDDNSSDFKKWFGNSENKSIETLVRMKDGYTVEKPQLFYLKHIDLSKRDPDNRDWYLIKDHQIKGKEGLEHDWVHREETPEEEYFKFTQQDIDSMQIGSYEQIEVEK